MKEFGYYRATDIDSAFTSFAEHPDTQYLGGGTNLIDLMKLGVLNPAQLIDVIGLGLNEITETSDGGVYIGAGVRNSDRLPRGEQCRCRLDRGELAG